MPFRRSGPDLVATFTTSEVALVVSLTEQLGDLLRDREPDDTAVARLLPDAYRDDPDAASEFRRFVEGDLVDLKLSNARLVGETVAAGDVRLGPDDVQAWLRTLTDLRLVIAQRLNISDDGDEGTGDPFLQDVYGWLGYVQGSILDQLEV